MNYVELEERLLNSINRTYGQMDEETTLDLYRLTRTIDWVNVCFSPERSIRSIRQSMSDDLKDVLNKITTGAILRLPEFDSSNKANWDLVESVVRSIIWRAETRFGMLEELDSVNFDEEEITDTFTKSPDLLLLYVLSNNTFIKVDGLE